MRLWETFEERGLMGESWRLRKAGPVVPDRKACHHERGMTKKGWTADQREDYCLE